MAASDYLEVAILDHVLQGVEFEMPDIYLALYTDDPTDEDVGTEVSGGSYARQQINPYGGSSPAFAATAPEDVAHVVANAHVITFPTATADWGTVTHFGLRDALSGGNLLFHGEVNVEKTVGTGDTFSAGVGMLKIRLK